MSNSRRPSHPHAGAKRESALSDSRTTRVIERVRAIPEGFVRTYGDIDARAPRLVGRILATSHDLPWHRVVRADGTIPQGQPQRELLMAEGVPMRGDRVDLDRARLPLEL
jgi:methylated-DNA-protein-cysteine methyltransferase related protein